VRSDGWFTRDVRVFVGGRDRSKAAENLTWQTDAVRTALGELHAPVYPALCFVEAERRLFTKPFQVNSVWVLWPRKLAEMVKTPVALDERTIGDVANQLAHSLPPKPSS
jgi:hypothetical protein